MAMNKMMFRYIISFTHNRIFMRL